MSGHPETLEKAMLRFALATFYISHEIH